MAKKTTASRAPAAEKDVTAVQGVAPADAGSNPPGTASLPSGVNGPEGSILEGVVLPPETTHSPESASGDADAAELSGAESPNGNDRGTVPVTLPNPEVPASASETAGALDIRSLKHVLVVIGCNDADELIALATAGQSAIAKIIELVDKGGPLHGFPADAQPAEMLEYLHEVSIEAGRRLEALQAVNAKAASADDKRRFLVCGRVRINGDLKEIGDAVALSEDEHAELLAAGSVASTWDEGFAV